MMQLLTGALLLLLLSLAGCKQVLYSQLGEQEANEILSVLALEGVNVEKIAREKHWAIEVAGDDMPIAMQILTREGLPRHRFNTLGELFKREGIISTPTEERVRFIHGVSQELSRTLTMIDGVLAARVHIVLPQNDPLADRTKPSSASVFIRHRAQVDMQSSLTAIKSLIVRSVEGLTHDTVYVSLFAAQRQLETNAAVPKVAFLGMSVSRSQSDWLAWVMAAIGVCLLIALAGFLGWRQYKVVAHRTVAL
jgi:type III secretion protein J